MRVRFARFLLLIVALWLPVQSMAAMSVPLCRHAHERFAPLPGLDVADHSAMPCHEVAPEHASHDFDCDNCEICHMASAGFMPSAATEPGLVPTTGRFVAAPVDAPPSFIAEPPQHPPRHPG